MKLAGNLGNLRLTPSGESRGMKLAGNLGSLSLTPSRGEPLEQVVVMVICGYGVVQKGII